MTHHPIATFIIPVGNDGHLKGLSGGVITGLDCASQVLHILDGVGLEQVLVVQMVKEDVQATLSIVDLDLERRGGSGLDARHICRQDFEDRLCVGRDMGTVTGGCGNVSLLGL